MEGACVVLSALAETSTDWGSDIKDLSIYSVLLIAIHLLSIYYTVYSIYITQSPGYYHGFYILLLRFDWLPLFPTLGTPHV